jgi:ribose transport system permease protein
MIETRSGQNTYLLIPILLLSLLLGMAVIRGPSLVSLAGFGSAIIVAAPLVLATYALMATAIAGRGTVDLAVGPLLGFINVSVVSLNGLGLVTSPVAVFVVALGIGVLYQLLFALVIIVVRVQPIIVALSGYLALTGINLVILPRPGGVAPEWMSRWGLGETIFSPVLLIVLLATGGWLLFTLSPFFKHLRLMGYDERAAYTSGVRISVIRIGAHLISGIFVGLGALCYTALISSGDPSQGTTMSLTAVTALVLGGVSLAGGRGSIVGALIGAVNLFLIGYVLATFNFGAVQAFVTQLSYGLILVLSLLLTLLVPVVGRYIWFISPYAAFIVLACVVAGIMLQVATADIYLSSPPLPMTDPVDLTQRYFLLGDGGGSVVTALTVSPMQKLLFVVVSLGLLTLVARVAVVEAAGRRFGVFGHVVVAGLVVLTLLSVTVASLPGTFGPLFPSAVGAP